MAEKHIMLVCNAGMSTSMLVQKMIKVAEQDGKNYDIFAVSTSKVPEKIKEVNIDAVLLGPQVRYMEGTIKEQVGEIPLQVIDMVDYGTMNAESVLKTAEAMFKER